MNTADILMNVWIDSIGLNNYTYQHLHLKGALDEKKFDGSLDINDPNLVLNFNGMIDMGDSVPDMVFVADIAHANLFSLNLLKRNPKTDLSTHLDVNVKAKNLDDLDGSVRIANTS